MSITANSRMFLKRLISCQFFSIIRPWLHNCCTPFLLLDKVLHTYQTSSSIASLYVESVYTWTWVESPMYGHEFSSLPIHLLKFFLCPLCYLAPYQNVGKSQISIAWNTFLAFSFVLKAGRLEKFQFCWFFHGLMISEKNINKSNGKWFTSSCSWICCSSVFIKKTCVVTELCCDLLALHSKILFSVGGL